MNRTPAARAGRSAGIGLTLLVAALSGCAEDVVLPDERERSVCGDGIVGPGEDCDVSSPGCTNCLATPGWTCVDNQCFVPCGNEIEGTGPTCKDAHKTDDCDMTGYWVSRETDFSLDSILNAVQTSSTWFVYRFSQSGSAFTVEEEIHCGIHVTGSATVDYTEGSLRGLMYENDQTPAGQHGPRRGTFRREGDGCRFSFDRWYAVRGATNDLLPAHFSDDESLGSLPPLPSVPDPLNPPKGPLPGANDPDGDGHPGASVIISGLVGGVRNFAQRDEKIYASVSGQLVPRAATQFAVPGQFNIQEEILSVEDCSACALIAAKAYVDPSLTPRVTLRFLGKSRTELGASTVVVGQLRANQEVDLATCANARIVLPHDDSMQ